MPNDKDPAPQSPQQPARIREAGNVEKRGGWLKQTEQPVPAAQVQQQGMPDKPQGGAGGQGGGTSQSGDSE